MMRRLVMLALVAVFGLTVVACNTVKGVGKDIESAGEGIQDVAD